jgi:hypothetical protein
MKKQAKKLTLAKETLRGLEESGDLKNAVGGTYRDSVCDGCDSGFNTCATFVRTCGATYLC